MKKISTLVILTLFLFNLGSVYVHGEEAFAQAKEIIEQKISCDVLTDNQLEVLGEYYMEQMHPGELHEGMDAMMGGEGSESLKQVHINMGRAFYCEEDGMMGSGGMMGMMMGGNMMSEQTSQTNMMQRMMGNWEYGFGYWSFLNVLYVILLIGLIILVYLWILKLWKNMKNKRGRK